MQTVDLFDIFFGYWGVFVPPPFAYGPEMLF